MPRLAEGNVQITAVLPEELVKWLDTQQKREMYPSRSSYVAAALSRYRDCATETNGKRKQEEK